MLAWFNTNGPLTVGSKTHRHVTDMSRDCRMDLCQPPCVANERKKTPCRSGACSLATAINRQPSRVRPNHTPYDLPRIGIVVAALELTAPALGALQFEVMVLGRVKN